MLRLIIKIVFCILASLVALILIALYGGKEAYLFALIGAVCVISYYILALVFHALVSLYKYTVKRK